MPNGPELSPSRGKASIKTTAGYQQPLVLTSALALFALIALAPPVMLAVSLTKLKLDATVWTWLIQKQVFSLTVDSLYMALVAAGTALIVGLPLGLTIGSQTKSFSSGPYVLFFLPLAIPPYLGTGCWLDLLGRGGMLPTMMHAWIGTDANASWLAGGWGAGIMLGFSYFPIITYLVVSGLKALAPSHEEAGMFVLTETGILGRITLPLLFPHIGTGFVLVFLLALTNYAVPALIGFKTFTVKIYAYFSLFHETAGAVLLSLPLVCICLALVLLLNRLMKGRVYFCLQGGNRRGSCLRLWQAKSVKTLCHAPALIVTTAPVVVLIYRTGSLENLKAAFDQVAGSIFSSFLAAFLSSFFLSLLAFLCGYCAQRVRGLSTGWGRMILLFPFALPSVLLSMGIIGFWNRPGLHWVYQSILVLSILWGAKYLPLAQRIMADHIGQIPVEFEEIAFVSRCSWFNSLRRIVWPLARPGFLVTWAVTYVFCVCELGGTLLVIPPGADTMPIRLYNFMHYGSSSMVAALGLILLAMTLIPLMLLFVGGKKSLISGTGTGTFG